MIYVGIDVSKDKHDCYIVNSDGKVLADVFTVENNLEGFDLLFQRLKSVARDLDNVKVGLEELKSLSRYRFDKIRQRAKLKQSVSRLETVPNFV